MAGVQTAARRLLTEAAAAGLYLTQAALTAQKGAANGLASLGADGKVPAAQITPVQLTQSPKTVTLTAATTTPNVGTGYQAQTNPTGTVAIPAQGMAITAYLSVASFTHGATGAGNAPTGQLFLQRSADNGATWSNLVTLSAMGLSVTASLSSTWLALGSQPSLLRVIGGPVTNGYWINYSIPVVSLTYQLFPTAS
jgi:hypothetical protein